MVIRPLYETCQTGSAEESFRTNERPQLYKPFTLNKNAMVIISSYWMLRKQTRPWKQVRGTNFNELQTDVLVLKQNLENKGQRITNWCASV